MAGPFYFVPEALPMLFASLARTGVALLLLYLNGKQRTVDARATRVFVVVLLIVGMRGTWDFFATGANLAGDPEAALAWFRARELANLPLDLAGLYFLAVYPKPRTWLGTSRAAPWLLIAAALSMAVLFLADPALHSTYARGEDGIVRVAARAPLTLAFVFPTFVLLALVFARDSVRTAPGPRRDSHLLVSLGCALVGSYTASAFLAGLALPAVGVGASGARLGGPYARLADVLTGLELALVGVILAYLARTAVRGRADPTLGRNAHRYTGVVLLAVATGVAVGAMGAVRPGAADSWNRNFLAFWQLGLPLLVSYALVRHQLFGIDVRIKWTIKQSTVAAIFLSVFFAVSEGAQVVFSDRMGALLGIGAAALLVFAFAPLHHFADRVATRAMPNVKTVGEMTADERAVLYRDQVRFAWQDGNLSADERRLLEFTRERLGLSVEEAARLEREAAPP